MTETAGERRAQQSREAAKSGEPGRGGEPARREPQGITAEMILDAAVKILEEEGHAAVTMRRVAGDLGVAPPTVYWHVGNKEALWARLMDRLEQDLRCVQPVGSTPAERICSVVRGLHQQLRRSPALHALAEVTGRSLTLYSPSQSVLVAEFQRAGMSPRQVGFALHNLLAFSASFFYVDVFLLKEGRRTHHFAGPDALAPELDPDTAAAVTSDADMDAVFEFQLAGLVDSLLALGDDG